MKLDTLTLDQCQQVRIWRNACLETLRTPYPLTGEQQEEFYRTRVCAREGPHRYWAIRGECNPVDGPERHIAGVLVGMGGLTYIQWENRIAEISLILDPAQRGKGLGEQAVDLLLEQAFDRLGLKTVYGECYVCNESGIKFWLAVTNYYEMGGSGETYFSYLPNRKFWAGKFWKGLYFSIDADDWRKVHGTI
jgi:RimJ/RimL family protein N-acetyltransferase